MFSEPAKSTRFILETLKSSPEGCCLNKVNVKIVCDLLEYSFIFVEPTCRSFNPLFKVARPALASVKITSSRFCTMTEEPSAFGISYIFNCFLESLFNKSLSSSLYNSKNEHLIR
ncbi:hypothetical protein WICPIJ_006390 [Wickerhamomyces pijperi]|uniref:Uncharacterized protein n=1 Tax=Wickerhamomyces pijperi TaxID=599730 RepID=A0A9P8Q436_WICPI|nr:hypothetical protein WICPIJ_006390 [Wickerhamomyces pijperi]